MIFGHFFHLNGQLGKGDYVRLEKAFLRLNKIYQKTLRNSFWRKNQSFLSFYTGKPPKQPYALRCWYNSSVLFGCYLVTL